MRPLLSGPMKKLDEEIQKDIIEIRRMLPQIGYPPVATYKVSRNGLLFSGSFKLVGANLDQRQAIGYLRVSRDFQSENHSLVTQAQHILALASERSLSLSFFYVDAGITGADSQRPGFQAMMRQATRKVEGSRSCDAVICYNLYRFYRGLAGLTSHHSALYGNGIELISVAEKHTDLGERDGKLLLYMRGIVGEIYLDDLCRTVRDNKLTRALKGYSNASLPPYGYCRGDCPQCTDSNGAGYCPLFGSKSNLWCEVSGDPGVFVPHPVDQCGFRLVAELGTTGSFSDMDIVHRINPPSPSVLRALAQAPRVPIMELEGLDMHLVTLQNGVFALQQPDESLRFFRPRGRPDDANPDRRFTRDSIRDMLQNPYYAGFVVYREQVKEKGVRKRPHKRFKGALSEIVSQRDRSGNKKYAFDCLRRDHGMLLPGLHIPLITVDQFERCQQVRGLRGHNPVHEGMVRRIYPLSGVLKCARCKGPFRGNAARGNVRYYEDASRVGGTSECPTRAFRAEGLEAEVFAHVEQLRIPEEWHGDILLYLHEGPEWEKLHRQRRSLHTRLNAAREMYQRGNLSQGEFGELTRDCQHHLQRLEQAVRAEDAVYAEVLRDFPRLWAAATDEERKGLLRCIFSVIWCRDGVITGYEVREPFKALFAGADSSLAAAVVQCEVEQLPDGLAQLPPA